MIKEYLSKFSLWAHGLAVSGAGVAVLIDSDGKLRDLLLKLFQGHPKIGTDLVILAGIVTIFVNARKKKSSQNQLSEQSQTVQDH